jgi:hypothetical protein
LSRSAAAARRWGVARVAGTGISRTRWLIGPSAPYRTGEPRYDTLKAKAGFRLSAREHAANMTDIGELPEYFWVHTTSTVVLVLLALLAVSALGAWTLSVLENLWQRYRWRGH